MKMIGMELELLRIVTSETCTVGVLYEVVGAHRAFRCFILEDPPQAVKIPGRTRIPAGRYEIKLRTEGGFNVRYKTRFGESHRGMLHLQDVPGFEHILIHCGNDAEDTKGCLLTGYTAMPQVHGGYVGGSEVAYRKVYPAITGHLVRNREVWLTVIEHG